MFWAPGFPIMGLKITLHDSDSGQHLDTNAPASYTDIKKGKNGKMLMTHHRGKSSTAVEVTTEDVKKNDNLEPQQKNGNREPQQKNEDGENAWTPEEDEKLKQMKADNKTWAQIAEDMGRAKHELQARFKEIKDDGGAAPAAPAAPAAKGDGGQKKKKNAKGGGGGDADFTSAEDETIKKMLAENAGYKKIATELGRPLAGALKERIEKLKAEGAASDEKKDDDDGGEKKKKKKKKTKGGAKDKDEDKSSADNDKKKKKKKHDPKPDKEDRKPPPKAPSTRSTRTINLRDVRLTAAEWDQLMADQIFTFGELTELMRIHHKHLTSLYVASRMWDNLGHRVNYEDVKAKVEQVYELLAMRE